MNHFIDDISMIILKIFDGVFSYFQLVFGSVSLFAQENEQMLKPHLHSIVNRSMELALTANEPYNYFLLLRALFRSIGGGNHDLLYQVLLCYCIKHTFIEFPKVALLNNYLYFEH